MLSRNLEQSLHRAIALAGEHRHEYSTLEHLLLALTEDSDAVAVMKARGPEEALVVVDDRGQVSVCVKGSVSC